MGLKGPRVALEKLQQFWVEADFHKNGKPQDHKDLNEDFFDVNKKSISYKLFSLMSLFYNTFSQLPQMALKVISFSIHLKIACMKRKMLSISYRELCSSRSLKIRRSRYGVRF
jgi:hypothetical protein